MDPVADMLIAVKNAYMAKKLELDVPYSKFKLAVARVFSKQNFIGKVEHKDSQINIGLLYKNNKAGIGEIKRISKLGRRVYIKSKDIKKVKGGLGMFIISTPQGVMTSFDAKKKKLGGEIICQVY